MEQDDQYLQYLIQECQEYIKEFETLKESIGNEPNNIRAINPPAKNNMKLKNQKARLQKQLVEACLQIERQKKEIQTYEMKFEKCKMELNEYNKQIQQKQTILASLNKQLQN